MSFRESFRDADYGLFRLRVALFSMCFAVVHLRRCVGKQLLAALELQLCDTVCSEESFFQVARATQPQEHEGRLGKS